MKKEEFNLEEEQKKLVLARFNTLNPEAKLLLGGEGEVTVRTLMEHVEKGDEFGKRIIMIQMKMLQVLASGAQ